MDLMEYRKCDKCCREKPYYDFYTDIHTICISCTEKANKEKELLGIKVKEE